MHFAPVLMYMYSVGPYLIKTMQMSSRAPPFLSSCYGQAFPSTLLLSASNFRFGFLTVNPKACLSSVLMVSEISSNPSLLETAVDAQTQRYISTEGLVTVSTTQGTKISPNELHLTVASLMLPRSRPSEMRDSRGTFGTM